jgi:hypothetical protein
MAAAPVGLYSSGTRLYFLVQFVSPSFALIIRERLFGLGRIRGDGEDREAKPIWFCHGTSPDRKNTPPVLELANRRRHAQNAQLF